MPFSYAISNPANCSLSLPAPIVAPRLFHSDRFRRDFVEVLGQLRQETDFLLIGWVLMPEPFHLLGKPALA